MKKFSALGAARPRGWGRGNGKCPEGTSSLESGWLPPCACVFGWQWKSGRRFNRLNEVHSGYCFHLADDVSEKGEKPRNIFFLANGESVR